MNKTILHGRLTKDPEIRYSQSGTAIARFTLAVNRMKKDEADFITCKAFGKTAEIMEKYIKKGTEIMLCGRIETGSYEKDGKKVYTTEVIADEIDFVGKKEEKPAEKKDEFVPVKDDEEQPFNFGEDLPF